MKAVIALGSNLENRKLNLDIAITHLENLLQNIKVSPYIETKPVGGAQGYGVAYASATLTATPVVNTIMGTGYTGAITTTPQVPLFYDLEGSIIVPPGGFVCSYTSSASGASAFFGSFSWEEVPV